MANKSSSAFLLICFFCLIISPLFVQLGLASRILADDMRENKTDNGQSKSGVHGSQSGHAGSYVGDGPPSGTVSMSPPTSTTKRNNPHSPDPNNQKEICSNMYNRACP
ncbi:uncharacterized protein LOC119992015 [Tripterygium wilfordii]|uniref:uncharacterized protein LOC119992015 n=1 Tax=Tripterygium wilfordii TaxID=458696 RepID=UPI0018F84F52|nr:uncharacterized protein LOC119992015 [Tripterygium wilfordii]